MPHLALFTVAARGVFLAILEICPSGEDIVFALARAPVLVRGAATGSLPPGVRRPGTGRRPHAPGVRLRRASNPAPVAAP